jgi:hypothetical protein
MSPNEPQVSAKKEKEREKEKGQREKGGRRETK